MTNLVIGILTAWQRMIEAAERTLVSNVAATVPWLAPIVPAYMTWQNAVTLMGFPHWVAWMAAAAVEGLGMSVVSTAFELWDWNDKHSAQDRSAPLWVAVLTVIFYLAVIVLVNVLLDLGTPLWIAKALLSLLSVPAVVTLALRSQHSRRVDRREREDAVRRAAEQKEKEEKAAERADARAYRRELKLMELRGELPKVTAKVSESDSKKSEHFGQWKNWHQVPLDHQKRIASLLATMSLRMAMEQVRIDYGPSERVAYKWLEYGQRDFPELAVSTEQLAEIAKGEG